MRIIIVGGIGYALARSLGAQHDLEVLDVNSGRTERFSHLDVDFTAGSGTNSDFCSTF